MFPIEDIVFRFFVDSLNIAIAAAAVHYKKNDEQMKRNTLTIKYTIWPLPSPSHTSIFDLWTECVLKAEGVDNVEIEMTISAKHEGKKHIHL